jgi:alkanesulfonate monooxygenase SsuD/methylene tetrahydromethanopterin reductase-like flavin-dependent oxidoreductase (luciferase family)
LARRIAYLHECLAAAGRPRSAVEVAPQLSVTIGASDQQAEDAYWRSGLVEHRRSLSYTGRDLSRQVETNLVGSAATIRDKVTRLADLGVDHCSALWFSTDSVEEMLEQMEWFASEVIRPIRGMN